MPYYPWKLSHAHHHRNTGNIDKEEVFHPLRERHAVVDSVPHFFRTKSYFVLGMGWFTYLLIGYGENALAHYVENAQGKKHVVKSHFDLRHHLFAKHQNEVIVSLMCVCLVVA